MSAVFDESDSRAVSSDDAHTGLLPALGERVRTLRAQRGMTRKILARDSGVSERYLALLENGDGNGSVMVLAKVAAALHVPVVELLREERTAPPEREQLQSLLKSLSPTQLKTAHDMLSRAFDAEVKARMRRIALVGLRGAGKSSLGAALAKQLRAPFVELDREVEREANVSLNEIFLLYQNKSGVITTTKFLEVLLLLHGVDVKKPLLEQTAAEQTPFANNQYLRLFVNPHSVFGSRLGLVFCMFFLFLL